MIVRQETADDHAAVHAVVAKAFGREDEAALIAALRRDGDLAISLVAIGECDVVGHIALSRLRSPPHSMALAPLAVSPSEQRRGVGSTLVRRAIELARQAGVHMVFVLGDPAYYSRFGFTAEAGATYPCPYAGPHFMALVLSDTPPPPSPVVYAQAFDGLT